MNNKYINKFSFFKRVMFCIMFCISLFFLFKQNAFAAKYTLTSGIDFNTRIKCAINSEYNSSSVEKTISGFKRSEIIPDGVDLIDISEDGDSSILAYIENNILYFISDDDVYFNKDMSYMFDKFVSIKRIDFTDFDFSKCKKMNFMFSNCISLNDLDFDNDTTISPNEIEGMFYNCQSLNNINIFMFDTKNVTSFKDLFHNCYNLKNIQINTEYFNINKVNDYSNTYKNCKLLKTNFGLKAMDINETLYKKYSKAGDDDTEGLLKDFDYEYDDYGENDFNVKVDSINNKLVDSLSSENTNSNFAKDFKLNAKKHIGTTVASDSSLVYHSAKDKKLLTDIDVENILISESTYVPDLEDKLKKFKEKKEKALDVGIEETEISTSSFVPGKVRRPTLEDYIKKGVENGRAIDNDTTPKQYTILDNTIIYTLIVIILIIFVGLILYRFRIKKDNKDIDKKYDDFS